MTTPLLKLSEKITLLPVIHGSGDFSIEVRRIMLEHSFDALAVPLPNSFREEVEQGIEKLPELSVVIQREQPQWKAAEDWTPDEDDEIDPDQMPSYCSYVPIEPCQAVVTALRIAMQERLPRFYLDLETEDFESYATVSPDPYAVKQLSAEPFSAALLPLIPDLPEGQPRFRVETMVNRLRKLEDRFDSILFVCSMLEWPLIRQTYQLQSEVKEHEDDFVEQPEIYPLSNKTAFFMLGEIPYVTGLYEKNRQELTDDENLSVDGVKELVLTARDRYRQKWKKHARKMTPKLLRGYFQYVRNLSLIEKRLAPDLYTLVVAAQQIFGDPFALQLLETANEYRFPPSGMEEKAVMNEHAVRLPDGKTYIAKSRLPCPQGEWRSCELKPEPDESRKSEWQKEMRWNPYSQCSWPPEDDLIERFRSRVTDAALSMINEEFAQSEKFTSSLKDGLDLRETIRHWHTGDLYVKKYPPNRGSLDSVVMLFDSPADPREYNYRTTWHAEHQNESTLCFYATDFQDDLVGPGIGRARYGGAWFLFPPVPISDIWHDQKFDFAETLEERMLAAACYYSKEKNVVLLSEQAPGAAFRKLARKFGKKWLHIPLGRFSQSTIESLRTFHVLNGKHIRSFASEFIRKA